MNSNKSLIALACELPSITAKQYLEVALIALRESEDVSFKVHKLSAAFGHSQEVVTDLLGLFGELLCIFTQTSPKKWRQTLEEGGFSSQFIDNFLLKSNQLKCSVPKLINCKWSVDISLTEGKLSKKLPMNIIVNLRLSDNKKYTFSMDIKTFHKLRLNLAIILRDLQKLQNSNVVKNRFVS